MVVARVLQFGMTPGEVVAQLKAKGYTFVPLQGYRSDREGEIERIAAWNRRAPDRASFDAGWEKAKLLLKPEDLSTPADHVADAGRMVS